MPKKQQKITKISQKNAILMSEKISVTPINKEFSQKYGVKVEYPLKQGLKPLRIPLITKSTKVLK